MGKNIKNKVVLNSITHTQASILIMNINVLQFMISFALIGIIVYVFIPNADSSPLPRSWGGRGSDDEGSNNGGRNTYSGSSYSHGRVSSITQRSYDPFLLI